MRRIIRSTPLPTLCLCNVNGAARARGHCSSPPRMPGAPSKTRMLEPLMAHPTHGSAMPCTPLVGTCNRAHTATANQRGCEPIKGACICSHVPAAAAGCYSCRTSTHSATFNKMYMDNRFWRRQGCGASRSLRRPGAVCTTHLGHTHLNASPMHGRITEHTLLRFMCTLPLMCGSAHSAHSCRLQHRRVQTRPAARAGGHDICTGSGRGRRRRCRRLAS